MPNHDYSPRVDELIADLLAVVERRAPGEAGWLRDRLAFDRAGFPPTFAAAGRMLGRSPIDDDAARIRIPWPATSGVDECGRGALVLSAISALPAEEHVALVQDLFRRGEVRERQAVLRVLAGLPEPERFVGVAIDAFRTNVQPVFEALACDNAFPARYLPDHAFDQLVLKCLFLGAPLGRVHGLATRITDELARMVEAYASERRAAGRSVPDDVDLVRRPP
jgi:hypothetical protein